MKIGNVREKISNFALVIHKPIIMKQKLSLFLLIFLMPLIVMAQKDVTTFLGIPVDGSKSEMKKKLMSKGFIPKLSGKNEYFEGEFNGTDVQIHIVTNNNKVYRLMICDANTKDEANIKIRFNRLVSQFEKNKRYSCLDDYTIKDGVDISYEMAVNNKNFDAIFYQNPDTTKFSFNELGQQLKQELLNNYTEEQLLNPTDEIKTEIMQMIISKSVELASKKIVWFRIVEFYGKYYITMYYDNGYNQADGEDL